MPAAILRGMLDAVRPRASGASALLVVLLAGPACRSRDHARPSADGGAVTLRSVDLAWRAVAPRPAPSTVSLWWEAEQPSATNFPASNPFAPKNAREADALSGRAWLGADAKGQAYFLEYRVEVPRTADYWLYARKFWRHGPARFRFDEQAFRRVGRDVVLLDETPVGSGSVANWVNMGKSRLESGNHLLRVELEEGEGASAWDAFVLTDGTFTPRGKLKPDQTNAPAPEGWFTFDPPLDEFTPSAVDLRSRNEARAGESGPIVVRNGALARHGSAEPLRFWGVNVTDRSLGLLDPERKYLARSLAKRGVNLVRIQAQLWLDSDRSRIDPKRLEQVQALVATLAANGIYSALSIYFPVWLLLREQDGIPGYRGDKPSFGVVYFDDRLGEIYRGWWKQILSAPNPHAPGPLASEPALALIELVNEDSTLFPTFSPRDDIPEPASELIERRFGRWLATRYGDLPRAFAAFGGELVPGDDVRDGRAGFLPLWQVASKRDARSRATAEFLARSMREFYERNAAYVKRDLGFRGPVVCSNWVTADARVLGPLDKWANLACDVMDHHGYFGGPHLGARAGYAVSPGDRFDDASALLFQSDSEDRQSRKFDLPIMDPTYDGKPSIVSELDWPAPNRFRAELPLLAAAYGSLQGTDAITFFAIETPGFGRMQSKFGLGDPALLGQFPALALAYRAGYVREGSVTAAVELPLERLFELDGAPLGPAENLDGLRKIAGLVRQVAGPQSIDPLSYLVGPVAFQFAPGGASTRLSLPSGSIDRDARRIKSNTGELGWDFGNGVLTVNATHVQGVGGFLAKSGVVELGDVRIASALEYGSIVLVSLDGAPLATSTRMLLEVVSEVRNTGFEAPGAGLRPIVDTGGPPLLVKRLAGQVEFKHRDPATLHFTALDADGQATQEATRSSGTLTLLPDHLYYLIATP